MQNPCREYSTGIIFVFMPNLLLNTNWNGQKNSILSFQKTDRVLQPNPSVAKAGFCDSSAYTLRCLIDEQKNI